MSIHRTYVTMLFAAVVAMTIGAGGAALADTDAVSAPTDAVSAPVDAASPPAGAASVPANAAIATTTRTNVAQGSPVSSEGEWDGKLHVNFTPYVWGPTVNGTFRYTTQGLTSPGGIPIIPPRDLTFDQQVGPSSYLTKLNFAFMGTIGFRIGPFALYADALNANAQSSAAGHIIGVSGPLGNNFTIGGGAQAQIVTTLWTIAPSVTLYHGGGTSVDVMVGGQFITVSGNANAQLFDQNGNIRSGGVSRKETAGEVIVGTYGRVAIGHKLWIPFLLDAGFGPQKSWEYLAGVQYGNVSLNWRYIQHNAVAADAFVQRLTLGGPLLGYTFHF